MRKGCAVRPPGHEARALARVRDRACREVRARPGTGAQRPHRALSRYTRATPLSAIKCRCTTRLALCWQMVTRNLDQQNLHQPGAEKPPEPPCNDGMLSGIAPGGGQNLAPPRIPGHATAPKGAGSRIAKQIIAIRGLRRVVARQPSSKITRNAKNQSRNGSPARFDRGSWTTFHPLTSWPGFGSITY